MYAVFGTKPMRIISFETNGGNTMYAAISSTHNRIMCCCISSRTSKMAFGCSGIVVIQP